MVYLKKEFLEWTGFWCVDKNSGKPKVILIIFGIVVMKNGCGLLGHGALKSAVTQEWIDELGWFCACWYKFMKGKSYFNNY